ncbi:hypothetical protein [Chelativorans sp. YIM 93263]|uniref:hypothetical protein n=1 Tax=Chelativorans sp. YIM 93263 TaxID=2906648 RepID=UPI00237857C0|nr:hypothetical protein [Chelativorans sp. YIM 93263]
MKLQVQPGKRAGIAKTLFSGSLDASDISVKSDRQVVISFLANDIYTPKSTQRYSITLSETEIEQFCRTLRAADDCNV